MQLKVTYENNILSVTIWLNILLNHSFHTHQRFKISGKQYVFQRMIAIRLMYSIFFQLCVTSVWCMRYPPRAIHHFLIREDNFLVCAASINASYMIAFAYPIGKTNEINRNSTTTKKLFIRENSHHRSKILHRIHRKIVIVHQMLVIIQLVGSE